MQVPIYRICGWDKDFENYRTRVVKGKLSWIRQKVSFDSDRIQALLRLGGAEAYGAFRILCAVAATCDERGTLVSGLGIPHTPDTLSAKTGVPEGTFACVIGMCLNLKLLEIKGHVEVEDEPERQHDDTATIPHGCADDTTTIPRRYDDDDRIEEIRLDKTTAADVQVLEGADDTTTVPRRYDDGTSAAAAAAAADKKAGEGELMLSDVVAALTGCGMDPQVIPQLTASHSLQKIMQALEMVRSRGNNVRNVAGLVRSALDGNWEGAEHGAHGRVEEQREVEVKRRAAERDAEKKQLAKRKEHLEILAALPPGEFEKLKQAAHKRIPPGMASKIDREGDPMEDGHGHGVWRSYMWTEYEKARASPQSGDLLPDLV